MHMMHPNQIATSEKLVRCLLRDQFPVLKDQPIADAPHHGTDCDTWRVGDLHAVRLPIIDWAVNDQERIRPWLPWLRDRLQTPVPVPLHYGTPACGYAHGWTVYPWIPGGTRTFGCSDERVAIEIAAFLTDLRASPTADAPAAGRSPHALDADVRASLAQLTEADGRDDLIAIWDEMMTSAAWDGTGAVWLHGDIAPGNLLWDGETLVAAIDWSGLGVGDPASDLQVAWNMLAEPARSAFRATMGVSDAVWDRARARAFAQASFQLPYYRDSLPALAAQAQYVFAEIRAEFAR